MKKKRRKRFKMAARLQIFGSHINLFYPYILKRVQPTKSLRSYDVVKRGGHENRRSFVTKCEKVRTIGILVNW